MGNAVGLDGDRLVTRNEKGQIVDYDEHIEGKRSATHQDLAITSMMMINPFMIFGLGAGMSFMNDSHMSSRQKIGNAESQAQRQFSQCVNARRRRQ